MRTVVVVGWEGYGRCGRHDDGHEDFEKAVGVGAVVIHVKAIFLITRKIRYFSNHVKNLGFT